MVRKVKQFVWKDRPRLNQIVVYGEDQMFLVSFDKVVASKGAMGVYLSEDWNSSRTMSIWIARFLKCPMKKLRWLINKGLVKVVPEIVLP